MWRHPVVKGLLLLYIVWGGWAWFIDRPVSPPDGILAPDEPVQESPQAAETFQFGHWILTSRATYQITARILHVERYRFDRLAALIPEDFALGWGPMSDSRILKSMEITQSDRFYFWRSPADFPVARQIIVSHSANTHIIPENALIAKQLSRLRRGEVVTLTGLLVDGARDDGAWIKTSLVRTDTGAGACEVMLVRDLQRVY